MDQFFACTGHNSAKPENLLWVSDQSPSGQGRPEEALEGADVFAISVSNQHPDH